MTWASAPVIPACSPRRELLDLRISQILPPERRDPDEQRFGRLDGSGRVEPRAETPGDLLGQLPMALGRPMQATVRNVVMTSFLLTFLHMLRTQIQLTADQARRLRERAAAENRSMADLVRDAVDASLRAGALVDRDVLKQRSLDSLGRFRSGATDLASEHDRHLDEAFAP
jgi:hypothetical protein